VRIASNEVVRSSTESGKFGNSIAPPKGTTIQYLEAATSGRLWIVTTDGKIFNHAPAPK